MRKGILVLMALVVTAATISAQDRARIQGTAMMFGSGMNTRTVTRTFDLIMTGRSSSSDVAALVEALQSGGNDALRRELERRDVGRFSLGPSVGVSVGAIMVDKDGADTLVRVIFARPISFGELRRGARSADYQFGYLEMRLDERGRGDGMIIPAARFRLRNGVMEVDDFGTFPGRLMGVRVREGTVTAK